MTSPIKVELDDQGVLLVTIDRGHRRNALDMESWQGLRDAFARASSPDVGAVVLTGAGSMFSAGADLKTLPKGGTGVFSSTVRLSIGHEVLHALYQCPTPTFAAVEGGAIGVGWSLALACDITIASEQAFFLGPFLERGFVPDGGITWFLNKSLGRHKTLDILMRSERMPAKQMEGLGLVSRVVPPGEALETARQFATKMAAGPRETIEIFKQLVRRSSELSLNGYLEEERAAFALNHFTGNPAEGAAAFVERRPPRFRRAD